MNNWIIYIYIYIYIFEVLRDRPAEGVESGTAQVSVDRTNKELLWQTSRLLCPLCPGQTKESSTGLGIGTASIARRRHGSEFYIFGCSRYDWDGHDKGTFVPHSAFCHQYNSHIHFPAERKPCESRQAKLIFDSEHWLQRHMNACLLSCLGIVVQVCLSELVWCPVLGKY